MPTPKFRGVINVDVRDSVPDWAPFVQPIAPPGAPNVVMVVWDDVGYGAMDVNGGPIETPTMQRIAQAGLRYSNFHTTALCSPTRSSLLNGRNATSNGMACIVEGSAGFPGFSARIPFENGMISEVLGERGWNTYAVGKWHLTPSEESDLSAWKHRWPLGRGFERYYGFLGGETDQWHPDLVYDNHPIDQPYTPDEGYHLSKDLVDKAIEFIRDAKSIAPTKPWMMYFCPGAAHAPHHVFKEWADKYRGRFDEGYEAIRAGILANQKQLGLMPDDVELSVINSNKDATSATGQPWPPLDVVRPWDTLSEDERRLFARMAEVYAGFVSYTDDEIGRLIDYLEESERRSTRTSSSTTSPTGSRTISPASTSSADRLPTTTTTRAGRGRSTPRSRTGSASPATRAARPTCAWSRGRRASRPAARCVTSTCTPSTSCPRSTTCSGSNLRTSSRAIRRRRSRARAWRRRSPTPPHRAARPNSTRCSASAPSTTKAGWSTPCTRPSGWSNFDKDRWELYHLERDRAQTTDLAAQEPARLELMKALWSYYAAIYSGPPLDDRSALEILSTPRPEPGEARNRYVYYPDTAEIPESVAVNVRRRSFTIAAAVVLDGPGAEGALFSQGAMAGEHSLFLQDNRLHYVYNWLGEWIQKLSADRDTTPGRHVLTAEFTKTSDDPATMSALGTLTMYIDDEQVGQGEISTQPDQFGLAGTGVCVGRDSGSPVTADYRPPFTFTGGTIERVVVDVSGDAYVDHEKEVLAWLARD